jgi:hypothetical protein
MDESLRLRSVTSLRLGTNAALQSPTSHGIRTYHNCTQRGSFSFMLVGYSFHQSTNHMDSRRLSW